MAITFGAVCGTGNTKAGSITFNYGASVAAGKLVVVIVAVDNLAITDIDENAVTSITDTASNVFLKAKEITKSSAAALAGTTCAIWYGVLKTAVTTSSQMTISTATSGSRGAISATLAYFNIGSPGVVVDATASSVGAADPPSLDVTTAAAERLRVRGISGELNNAVQMTATASWGLFTAVTSTGANTNTNQAARGEYRIVSTTTAASDPTWTALDNANCYVAFKEGATTNQAVTATGGSTATVTVARIPGRAISATSTSAVTVARISNLSSRVTAAPASTVSVVTNLIVAPTTPRDGVKLLTRYGPSGHGIRRGFTPPPGASTPSAITAASGSTASVTFTSVRGIAITATNVNVASVLGLATHQKAITATGGSTVLLSRLLSLSKLVAPVSPNSVAVQYLPAIARTIVASAGSTASVSAIRVNAKEIVATGASAVTLVKQILKSVVAAGASTASVSRVLVAQRTIAPVSGSLVDLGWQVGYHINAIGPSSVSVAHVAAHIKQIVASSGASAVVSRQVSALRTSTASGGSTATVGAVATKIAAATAAGLATVSGGGNTIIAAQGTVLGHGDAQAINPGGGVTSRDVTASGTSTVSGFGSALARATGTVPVVGGAFSPANISGLLLWLDVADNATITAIGGFVSAINNKGSVGGGFTQPTVDKRFQLRTTAWGQSLYSPNSAFTDRFMTGGTNAAYDLAQLTIVTVAKTESVNGMETVITRLDEYWWEGWQVQQMFDGDVQKAIVQFNQNDIYDYDLYLYNYSGAYVEEASITTNRPIVAIAQRSSSGTQANITGHTPDPGDFNPYPAPIGSFPILLGGSYDANSGVSSGYWDGDIHEVLLYDRALTDAERESVEGYLAWKWGLQADLPSAHSYKSAAPGGLSPIDAKGIGVANQVIAATGTAFGDSNVISIGRLASRATAFGTSDAVGKAAGVNDSDGIAHGTGSATGFMLASALTTGSSIGLGTANAVGNGITAITGTAFGTGSAYGAGGQIIQTTGTAQGTGSASAGGQQVWVAVGTAKGGKRAAFTPMQISNPNLQFWIDASDSATIITVGGPVTPGQKVMVLANKGYAGSSLTQLNGLKQFTLADTTNGRALQNLSAGEDFFMSGDTMTPLDVRDMTVFGVAFRSGSSGTFSPLISRRDGPGNDGWNFSWAWVDPLWAYSTFVQTDQTAGFTQTEQQAYALLNSNRAFMAAFRRSPAALQGDVAGNIPQTGPAVGSYTPPVGAYKVVLGGTDTSTGPVGKWQGNIHEVLIYTWPLTLLEAQQVEGYLAHKWKVDLQWSDHPYKNAPPEGADVAAVAFAQLVTAGTGTSLGQGTAQAVPGFMGIAVGAATVAGLSTAAAIGTGTANGTSNVVGIGIAGSRGTAGGIGTATGFGNALTESIGIAGGIGNAVGLGTSFSVDPAPGTAFGSCNVVGIGIASASGIGTSLGAGTASGEGAAIAITTGTAGGIGTATGVGMVVLAVVGSANGIATVQAGSVTYKVTVGTASGAGSCAAIAVQSIVVFPTGAQAVGQVGNANVFWGLIDPDIDDIAPVGREIWEPIVV